MAAELLTATLPKYDPMFGSRRPSGGVACEISENAGDGASGAAR